VNQDQKIKLLFAALLAAHACFIIYGSIVPFGFEYIPLSEAWEEFKTILFSPVGRLSRANLMANVLIGIPGPFLFLAVFHNKRGWLILALVPAALLYSALLASTAEFLQIFLPGRMTMLSDILAQTAGGAAGVLFWLWIGPYFRAMVKALIFQDKHAGTESFLFWCYLSLLLLLHALPLDLSARPGPLYAQLEDGRILLVPFSSWTGPSSFFNSLQTVLFWMPVGWFLVRIRGWSLMGAVIAAALGAALFELIQIFVLSRITDSTNIILGSAGALTGGIIGTWKKKWKITPDSSSTKKTVLGALIFSGWLLLVIRSFWAPFTFTLDKDFLRDRINEIGLVPLQTYLGKPYTMSAFNILELFVYFIPLGIIFSTFITRRLGRDSARVMAGLFFIIACLLAVLVELGQVFIPGRYPDITDVIIMVTGAMLGHSVTNLVWKRHSDG
jgi:VanZ family protein